MRKALLFIFLSLGWSCHAFCTRRRYSFTRCARRLSLAAKDGDENQSNNNNNNNLDSERQRLEALIGNTASSFDVTADNSFRYLEYSEWKTRLESSPPPPLTSIGRERLEMEIQLLESLATSDAAVSQLWNLWYTSRGPGPAEKLVQTEVLVSQGLPDAWAQAEELLRELVAQEGLYWAEPVNRLATLLFLQARYEESKELCEVVLKVKPWHFGALSGIVLVCQGLNDQKGLVHWATQRMPPLGALQPGMPETRDQWVDRMIDQAKASLLKGEMGLEESFQDCDDEDPPKNVEEIKENDDEWQ